MLKIKKYKKLFSYFIPQNIFVKKSNFSKLLELTWANGKLVLDSENTNYSYGSLQRILRKGLENIGFEKIISMQNILLLGVAGGSVVKTLVDEIHFKGKITGVEIDSEIIQIANKFFKLDEIKNLEIVIEDAFEFVIKDMATYNLIIIDVFQDNTMPAFLFQKKFIDSLKKLLKKEGFLLFNTMVMNEKDDFRNKEFVLSFNSDVYNVKTISKIEQHNELIIVKKNV